MREFVYFYYCTNLSTLIFSFKMHINSIPRYKKITLIFEFLLQTLNCLHTCTVKTRTSPKQLHYCLYAYLRIVLLTNSIPMYKVPLIVPIHFTVPCSNWLCTFALTSHPFLNPFSSSTRINTCTHPWVCLINDDGLVLCTYPTNYTAHNVA